MRFFLKKKKKKQRVTSAKYFSILEAYYSENGFILTISHFTSSYVQKKTLPHHLTHPLYIPSPKLLSLCIRMSRNEGKLHHRTRAKTWTCTETTIRPRLLISPILPSLRQHSITVSSSLPIVSINRSKPLHNTFLPLYLLALLPSALSSSRDLALIGSS